jgi:protein-disulfide isomerase
MTQVSRTTARYGALCAIVALATLIPGAAFAGESSELPPAVVIGGLSLAVLFCMAAMVWRGVGLLVASIFGAAMSAYLAHQHQVALHGGSSICNISSVINCDAVNTSRYSELFGIPIALFGFGFYVAVGWLSFKFLRGGESKSAAAGMIAVLSVLAVGYDLYLAYASYSLGAICLFCTFTWVLNVLLLVGSVAAAMVALLTGSTVSAKGAALVRAVSEVGGGAVITFLSAVIVANLAYQSGGTASVAVGTGGGQSADVAAPDLATLYEQPAGQVTLDGTEPMKGDPNAKFTLVEWADFQCPHCAVMFPVMEEILLENKDVKLYFRHYPISQACNRFVEGLRHENACQAAAAAECARLQGRFWELSGQMFKNQEYLGKDDLRFMVEQVGLDPKAFETCMNDPATAQAVVADVEGGGAAQINGTPSIFLKGAVGDGWVRVIGGKEAINTILAAARSGKPMPAPAPPNPDR